MTTNKTIYCSLIFFVVIFVTKHFLLIILDYWKPNLLHVKIFLYQWGLKEQDVAFCLILLMALKNIYIKIY